MLGAAVENFLHVLDLGPALYAVVCLEATVDLSKANKPKGHLHWVDAKEGVAAAGREWLESSGGEAVRDGALAREVDGDHTDAVGGVEARHFARESDEGGRCGGTEYRHRLPD